MVDSYFAGSNTNISAACNDIAEYMYFDVARRSTEYEHDFELGLPADYPTGYFNITKCFYDFHELLTISESSFFDAFIYGVPEESEGAGTEIPLSNTYLDHWAEEIEDAKVQDLANVRSLAEWCKNGGGNCDLICLYEDRGRIISQKMREEIARIIFIDRHLKEVVLAKSLAVHIPTYLR